MAKLTVLLVINDSSRTGAPSQVRLIAVGLKSDYDIICCCPDGWLKQELEKSGVATRPWPIGRFRAQKNALVALYRQINPDLIHCHGIRAGIVGRLAARPVNTKIVYTEHLWTKNFQLKNPLRQWLQMFLMRRANKKGDWTVAVSEAVESFLVSNKLADSDKTSVIYGAIEPIEAKPDLDGQVIGTLGRLTWVKGIPTLLKAVSYIIEGWPNLICRIGGDGPEMASSKQLATMLGIQKHCQWLGSISDPATFFTGLSIYIQPSISESFGLVAGEAMSAGVPVIASRVGGLKELIADNETGLLFPSGDAEALGKAIIRLLEDKDLRERLSESGRKKVASFSIERFLAEHQKLYNSLANG